MVQCRAVLNDRQAKAGAAARAAVALINAVKPFKYALLVGRRDTDAGIGYAHKGRAVFLAGFERNAAVRLIIGNRICLLYTSRCV